MRLSSQKSLTVPVKPFAYQPRPASFRLGQLFGAQAAGVMAALLGWPLFFLVSMSLPLTLLQRGWALPGWFVLAFSMGQFLAFGMILGLAQMMVIADWVRGKKRWLASSGLVMLLVMPAAAALGAQIDTLPAAVPRLAAAGLAGALGGLLLGVVQARFLAERRAGWRALSALTWAAAVPLAAWLYSYLSPLAAPLLRGLGG